MNRPARLPRRRRRFWKPLRYAPWLPKSSTFHLILSLPSLVIHFLALYSKLREMKCLNAEFVIASPDGGHVRWLQKMSQRIQKSAGFKFRPHDLRRTCATNLSKLGVDDVTIATILNHSWPQRHMTAVYNRWDRLPEMKRALERWGTQAERIVRGKGATKIVKFKRFRRADGTLIW